ncbi:MAG: class I SAM-dependent methyltransferase [Elusimicrobia bacterium]|nr:class I SAM-dependent methyltransferase [Elusimicrobiota bacterium]
MSRVFGGYARYYDLLYRDKDYAGEAAYIGKLFKRFGPGVKTVMEFGSGTGRHALFLARKGYAVCGVERSAGMLRQAEALVHRKRAGLALKGRAVPEFIREDIRSVRLGRRFDAVLALFHVVSYQIADKDLRAAFMTAREHVREGGLFIFDAWHGPAVLADPPASRSKIAGDAQLEVLRRAEPVIHPERAVVEVKYHLRVKWKAAGKREELRETHFMRYLFAPEVEGLANDCGFKILHSGQWLTGRPLDGGVWNACFVLRGC